MKILVQQFARLGDLYLTWPTLNALLRENPSAEIHLLVRERYSAACRGLDSRIQVHTMRTSEILEPIYQSADVDECSARFSSFVDPLVAMKFDRVINLSFSPFSSYLSHIFELAGTKICGYTRHSDGFFNMPDDGSAYFYAQVGIDRSSRYHLADLFGHIAGVELKSVDFNEGGTLDSVDLPASDYLCIHVGASQSEKGLSKDLIKSLIDYFCVEQGLHVVLIGTESEAKLLPDSLEEYSGRLHDFVGKTSVPEAFELISRSFLTVGPDSFAMHVASLSETPCINLSCRYVNFWETGPLSRQSQVIWRPRMSDHSVEDVRSAFESILSEVGGNNLIHVTDWVPGQPRYTGGPKSDDFGWQLIHALYSGGSFPTLDDYKTYQAIENLSKMAAVAIEALPDVLNPKTRKSAFELLTQVDRAIENLEKAHPKIAPLIRWFQTEKIRLGPQPIQELAIKTSEVFQALYNVCSYYVYPKRPGLHGGARRKSYE